MTEMPAHMGHAGRSRQALSLGGWRVRSLGGTWGGLTWGLDEPATAGELEQHQPVGPIPWAEVRPGRGQVPRWEGTAQDGKGLWPVWRELGIPRE